MQNGIIDILNWAHDNNLIKLTTKSIKTATREGHLHVLKWLSQRFPLKPYVTDICLEASKHSKWNIMSWLKESNLLSNDLITIASKNGSYELFDYCIKDEMIFDANIVYDTIVDSIQGDVAINSGHGRILAYIKPWVNIGA